MKRSVWLVVVLLAACDSGGVPAGDGDGGEDLSVYDDGGVDGAIDTDLGPDGSIEEPDGSVVPTGDAGIGAVGCGAMPCDVATNVCCITFQGGADGGVKAVCEPANMCMGSRRACDGPEDCAAGTPNCCANFFGTTSCQANCPNLQSEACHAVADCPAPSMNRTAACCPVSATLRVCRTFGNGVMVPATCN